jgi:pSer/pThr/pTyr-binding forkhead associated (FHA) protein
MIMSGVDDGKVLSFALEDGDGSADETYAWLLSIGRRDHNDIRLQNDTFISREHARLYLIDDQWWIEDCESKNGTFLETDSDEDARVTHRVPFATERLFRIGRTWLRLVPTGE